MSDDSRAPSGAPTAANLSATDRAVLQEAYDILVRHRDNTTALIMALSRYAMSEGAVGAARSIATEIANRVEPTPSEATSEAPHV